MMWTTLMAWWMGCMLGCASLAGLEELEALPPAFPLEVGAPTGRITRGESGLVAVDLLFDEKSDAVAHWTKLRTDAEASGWTVASEGRKGKRDTVVLESPQGRVELGCCLQRADRLHLVFVSWWPAD
jgi:hypothetical protein